MRVSYLRTLLAKSASIKPPILPVPTSVPADGLDGVAQIDDERIVSLDVVRQPQPRSAPIEAPGSRVDDVRAASGNIEKNTPIAASVDEEVRTGAVSGENDLAPTVIRERIVRRSTQRVVERVRRVPVPVDAAPRDREVPLVAAALAAPFAERASPSRPSDLPRRRSDKRETAPSNAPAAPSTIAVSIGRIDVRAAIVQPTAAKRDVPNAPKLSLGQFLEERGAGRR